MNFDRVHIGHETFEIMLRCKSEAVAKRYAIKHGHRWTLVPGRGWVVIRPINPLTGLPVEKVTA